MVSTRAATAAAIAAASRAAAAAATATATEVNVAEAVETKVAEAAEATVAEAAEIEPVVEVLAVVSDAVEATHEVIAEVPTTRVLPVTVDLEHLALLDQNEIEHAPPKNASSVDFFDESFERCIGLLARNNTQLLVNALYGLERRRQENDDTEFFVLPAEACLSTGPAKAARRHRQKQQQKQHQEQQLQEQHQKGVWESVQKQNVQGNSGYSTNVEGVMGLVPRAKPVPQSLPETKWQRFAREKGIVKRSRSRTEYDEASGEYLPRTGYASARNREINQWAVPVKTSEDAFEDPYQKMRQAKRARVAKNEAQQMRNLGVEVKKGSKPKGKSDAVSGSTEDKDQTYAERREGVRKELRASKTATASAGVFDAPIKGDVHARSLRAGMRRTFRSATEGLTGERDQARSVVEQILKKKPILDTKRAANIAQRAEESRNRALKYGASNPNKDKAKSYNNNKGKGKGKGKGTGKGKGIGKSKGKSTKGPGKGGKSR